MDKAVETSTTLSVRIFDTIRSVDRQILRIEKGLIVFSLLAMVCGIFVESVSRWLFDSGLSGMSESTRFLMVYVGFMGASVATSEKKHIVIDIAAKALGNRKKNIALLNAIAYLLSTAVLLFLFYGCWTYLLSSGIQNRVSPALNMPLRNVVIIMPVATFLMAARFFIIALEEGFAGTGILPIDYVRSTGGLDELLDDAGQKKPEETI